MKMCMRLSAGTRLNIDETYKFRIMSGDLQRESFCDNDAFIMGNFVYKTTTK